MPEDRIIDLKTVIGVYPISNTGAVLVHRIDYTGDRVQASINGVDPVWTELKEQYIERTGEMELGFFLDQFFVPFCEIMRFHQ
ncbi:MAG: hypothetical protein IJV40_15725 [Oscillospiraceae bacterium]|nr:hypothetical protein [Oscillospiraceae bacterium]